MDEPTLVGHIGAGVYTLSKPINMLGVIVGTTAVADHDDIDVVGPRDALNEGSGALATD
jgi:hypothetical protein